MTDIVRHFEKFVCQQIADKEDEDQCSTLNVLNQVDSIHIWNTWFIIEERDLMEVK